MFDIRTLLPEAQCSSNIPSDITFSIRSNNQGGGVVSVNLIYAHKYFLALASPVFKALLYGNWFQVPAVIEITNASKDGFQAMIDFIYGKEININGKTKEQLEELKELADLYQLPDLDFHLPIAEPNKPELGIPNDIQFKVVEDFEEEKKLEDDCDEVGLIPAHKYRLALISKVFAARFFGPMASENDHKILPIWGTTHDAFNTIIKFINNDKLNLQQKTITELWNILDQAEMYDLIGIKEMVTQTLADFPLTNENVIKVAHVSENYSHFEDFHKIVLNNCAIYLHSNIITDVDHAVEYVTLFSSDSPQFTAAMKLFKMRPIDSCLNCQQYPCVHGRPIRLTWKSISGLCGPCGKNLTVSWACHS